MEKTLLIIKLEPELFYSLLDEKTKESIGKTIKNIEIVHCYNCHSEFVKGQIKECRRKKESCDVHGLHELDDKGWWSDEIEDCRCIEFDRGDEICDYSIVNKNCVSIDEFKNNCGDVDYFREWLLKLVGRKNINISREELTEIAVEKFEDLFPLKYNRSSTCNNKNCVGLLDVIKDAIKSLGWKAYVKEARAPEDIKEEDCISLEDLSDYDLDN